MQTTESKHKQSRVFDTRMMPSRIIPSVRLLLIAAISLLVLLDAWVTGQLFNLTEGILLLYLIYSAILYILTVKHSPLVGAVAGWEHWADMCWFAMLIMLNSQRSSLFFFGLFFPFLVASFRWGLAAAMRVTVVSTLIYTVVLLAGQMRARRFDLDHLLIPAVTLLVLGGMVSYWGGFEILLKRRLALLAEVTHISNPRFGAAHTISSLMEKLRAFYDADCCMLVMADLDDKEVHLRRADRLKPGRAERAESIPRNLASQLSSVPDEIAVVHQNRSYSLFPQSVRHFEYDVVQGQRMMAWREASERLGTTLDAECFVTVPIRYRNELIGRIFLTAGKPLFGESDIYFIVQIFEQVMPVIDNIRLVDRLATEAGTAERKRIAHDLHDSVIQPYIGLSLGLSSLREKLVSKSLTLEDINRLLDINAEAIEDLRCYVRALKGQAEQEDDLVSAVKRFAAKFSDATGIAIDVETEGTIAVNDRLAAEALQIVSEGLSNIRRHTPSMKAKIGIACSDDRLILRISDIGDAEFSAEPFVPRSITERAEALGGSAGVRLLEKEGSTVVVEVPL
jgi:signal transduction histidine kinase